ncbi:MAG TPA: hypothetical protein EYP36_12465 [Calditrichaeota bacterium]|nr:hypothetical protein [Calditrichota bacterium]
MENDSASDKKSGFDIRRYHRYFWILVPTIAIGGMFYPLLGLLMLPMMIILLVLSYFKARYWCNNLCARSSYMNVVVGKASRFNRVPGLLLSPKFRYGFLGVFFAVFLFRIYSVATQFRGVGAA